MKQQQAQQEPRSAARKPAGAGLGEEVARLGRCGSRRLDAGGEEGGLGTTKRG